VATRRRKYLPRFVSGEDAFFTEHIAVFGELFFGDTRQHFVYDEIDVSLAARFVFVGNVMRAKKCGNVVEWRFFIKSFDCAQDLQFVFQREAVS
jgi:hypothetical protein